MASQVPACPCSYRHSLERGREPSEAEAFFFGFFHPENPVLNHPNECPLGMVIPYPIKPCRSMPALAGCIWWGCPQQM